MRTRLLRRTILTCALAGLGALPAPAASAAGPATCTFNGATSQLTPVPATGGGTGTYTLFGTMNCATASGVLTNILVATSGTYSNIQCGTGTMAGSMASPVGSFSYSVTLAAFQGVLTATSPGDQGGGPVSLVPQAGGCVTAPVTSMTFDITFAGIFS